MLGVGQFWMTDSPWGVIGEGLQQSIWKLALPMTKDNHSRPDSQENFEPEGKGNVNVQVSVDGRNRRYGGSLKACVPFP